MMPPGAGQPPVPNDMDMMAGMDAMLGGAPPMGPPGGATPMPSGEGGGEPDAVAVLATENIQLRALLGLGPNDPIPAPEAAEAGPAPVGPASAAPGGVGLPPM